MEDSPSSNVVWTRDFLLAWLQVQGAEQLLGLLAESGLGVPPAAPGRSC